MAEINTSPLSLAGINFLNSGSKVIQAFHSLMLHAGSLWTLAFSSDTTPNFERPRDTGTFYPYDQAKRVFQKTFNGTVWYLEMFNLILETGSIQDSPSPVDGVDVQFIVWRVGRGHAGGVLSNAGKYHIIPVSWYLGQVDLTTNPIFSLTSLYDFSSGNSITDLFVLDKTDSLFLGLYTYNNSVGLFSKRNPGGAQINAQGLFLSTLDQGLGTEFHNLAYTNFRNYGDKVAYNNLISASPFSLGVDYQLDFLGGYECTHTDMLALNQANTEVCLVNVMPRNMQELIAMYMADEVGGVSDIHAQYTRLSVAYDPGGGLVRQRAMGVSDIADVGANPLGDTFLFGNDGYAPHITELDDSEFLSTDHNFYLALGVSSDSFFHLYSAADNSTYENVIEQVFGGLYYIDNSTGLNTTGNGYRFNKRVVGTYATI